MIDMKFPKREEFDAAEQTRDRSARHAGDSFLRYHGFKIHGRPRQGPPTWERFGEVFTQAEAHRIADELQEATRAAR